jgi:hypothetical protein
MHRLAVIAVLAQILALLAACSKPAPPVGKWEGATSIGGTMVAARVEIGRDGKVRISAPDITNAIGPESRLARLRERLAADLANAWDDVAPRAFDFDGKIFRKPGGIAPQMVWDAASNQMTLELYIGANPALPVSLRPVRIFHDNPWPQG